MSKFELNIFQLAAVKLVVNKVYEEYLCQAREMPVEPESFVEEWIYENITDSSERMRNEIWKYFLTRLIKSKGSR